MHIIPTQRSCCSCCLHINWHKDIHAYHRGSMQIGSVSEVMSAWISSQQLLPDKYRNIKTEALRQSDISISSVLFFPLFFLFPFFSLLMQRQSRQKKQTGQEQSHCLVEVVFGVLSMWYLLSLFPLHSSVSSMRFTFLSVLPFLLLCPCL